MDEDIIESLLEHVNKVSTIIGDPPHEDLVLVEELVYQLREELERLAED